MFATIEEAEKAAAMLRRFGVYAAEPRKGDDGRWKIDPGVDQAYLWDWGQVADYLLARPYPGEYGTYMRIEAVNVDEPE